MAKLTKKDWELIENMTNFNLVWTKSHIIFEKKIDENYSLLIRLRYVYGRLIFDFYGNNYNLGASRNIYEGGRIFTLPLDIFENSEQKQFFKENSNFDESETFDKEKIFQFIQIKVNFLEKDFGTIQKCLETYDNDKYPDYTFNREMGWMYFGFLNAIYGDKKRAIELLEKFIDSILEYQKQRIGTNLEYLNDEKNGQWFDFYRIRACEKVIEAIKNGKNSEEIKELIKFHTELEEAESNRQN